MGDRPGRQRRTLDLVGACALVAVLAGCAGGPGDLTVACPAIMYSARLEVRLDDSWSDPDAYGVAVSCLGTTESCGLVRDGTIRLVPEQEPTTSPPGDPDDPDRPLPDANSPEPTATSAPEEPGDWTGSALNGPVGTVVVRVVEVASGDVVVEREVDPVWESADGEASECGGPSLATVEIADPRA